VPLVSDETFMFLEQLLELEDDQSIYKAGFDAIKNSGNTAAATQLLAFVLARTTRERVATSKGQTLTELQLPSLTRGKYGNVNLAELNKRYAIAGTVNKKLNLSASDLSHVKAAGVTFRDVDVTACDLSHADLRYANWSNCFVSNAQWPEHEPTEKNPRPLNRIYRPFADDLPVLRQFYNTRSVRALAYSPDGEYITTGNDDGQVLIFDVETGEKIKSLSGSTSPVNPLAYSPDGKYITTGNYDGQVLIFDVETGEQIKSLSGNNSWVRALAYSPDGKYITTGNDVGRVLVFDVETGEKIKYLSGNNISVNALAYSPDGKYITTGNYAGRVLVFDVETGEKIKSLSGNNSWVRALAYSPDGEYITTGDGDGQVLVFDVETGEQIKSLSGNTS
jgi:WD40 repeat protein